MNVSSQTRKRLIQFGSPVAILAVSVAGFFALGKESKPTRSESSGPEATLVETVSVETGQTTLPFELDGLVTVHREVPLSAQVTGLITQRHDDCRAGQFVKQNTVLFQIEKDDYQYEFDKADLEWKQAQANLQELDVEIANTQASLELAQEEVALRTEELQRAERLSGRGVSTTAEYEAAQRNDLQARTNRQTLRNQLAAAQTRRTRLIHAEALALKRKQRAQRDLERTTIRAPFDAIVVGDPVEMQSMVQMGTQLVRLESVGTVEVRTSLKMNELNWLRRQPHQHQLSGDSLRHAYEVPPTQAKVRYAIAGRHYEWSGLLQRFDGWGLNEQTRTSPCRVVIDKPQDYQVIPPGSQTARPPTPAERLMAPALMRGLYVKVHLEIDPGIDLWSLPERAIRPGGRVWCLRDGKLKIAEVRVVQVVHGQAIINPESSELLPSDQVVISPLAVVTAGMPLRAADSKASANESVHSKTSSRELDEHDGSTVVTSKISRDEAERSTRREESE